MTNSKDTAFFTILLLTVLLLSVFNYRNIDVLESRINTVAKYKITPSKLNSEKGFKEDYYITQQSHDTNLILVVFGVLVAITGFFTYKNIDSKFEDKANELKKEIDTYRNEWLVMRDNFDELKFEFLLQSAELCKEIASKYLQEGNLSEYVLNSFASVSKMAELCVFNAQFNNEELLVSTEKVQENIKLFLVNLDENMDDMVSVDNQNFDIIEEYIYKVRKVENRDVDRLLNKIHTKIQVNED